LILRYLHGREILNAWSCYHTCYICADTFDEALAAQVLAHMSAGGSTAPPSPTSSSKATLLAPSPKHEQPLHQPPYPPGFACASAPYSMLRWGPTELITQRSSLLAPALAEQLSRITMLHRGTPEASAAAAALVAATWEIKGTSTKEQQQNQRPQEQLVQNERSTDKGGRQQQILNEHQCQAIEQQQQQQHGDHSNRADQSVQLEDGSGGMKGVPLQNAQQGSRERGRMQIRDVLGRTMEEEVVRNDSTPI